MMIKEFFTPCTPPTVTAQQKGATIRNGRIMFFTKKKVRSAERYLYALLHSKKPAKPYDVPLVVDVCFVYPYRKSESRRNTAEGKLIPHDVRPDRDNIAKLFFDMMTDLKFWKDDSIIYGGEIRKYWGAEPGIYVRIFPKAHESEIDAFETSLACAIAEWTK